LVEDANSTGIGRVAMTENEAAPEDNSDYSKDAYQDLVEIIPLAKKG
jgi:hypothetical protein